MALYTPTGNFWCMTERGRRSLSRSRDTFDVGRSRLHWTGTHLEIDLDEVTVPIPRRVRGRITLRPRALTSEPFALDAAFRHAWWPLAPSSDVDVALDLPGWTWSGRGYMDRNWGMEPLEDAFATWTWSRTHFADDTLLLYDAALRSGATRALALSVDRAGQATHVAPPPLAKLDGTAWRIPRETRSAGPAQVVKTLVSAPFYARSSVATLWQGVRGIGMHEALSLDRFRNPLIQAMLPFRMPRRG